MSTDVKYGFQATVNSGFDDTVASVTSALKAEGFGILTEINMQATLKAKLDVDIEKYMILGACNPPLANQALQLEQTIGLLLPCNVIVYQKEASEQTQVAILDPGLMVQLTENDALKDIADDARARLERVMQAIQS